MQDWTTPDRALVGQVDDFHSRCVEVYRRDPNRVEEDAGKERGIAEGGYGRKQIQELIQNSADALQRSRGRVQVVLTEDTLYVANEGAAFSDTGVRALLYTHLSNKSGTEIGRFGLGFKSISGISDAPQIFSQSVSFEFSREQTAKELSTELGMQLGEHEVPALRIAWPIDPTVEFRADQTLRELASWAVTVVKVPLKRGAADQLSQELETFDESFTLFAPHVRELELRDLHGGETRKFNAKKKGNRIILSTNDEEREWLVVSADHKPSAQALESAGHAARREILTVSWAVPTTGRAGVGQLSAFFPVKSGTTLSGRINAPWKLSDDRINVIECEFNYEILSEVVPQLVVNARKELVADSAYGRYIDILPARGRESLSWADDVINEPIYQALRDSRCLPDLDGQLKSPNSIQRIPNDIPPHLTARWLEVAGNRSEWVHPDCTTSNERRSKVDRLFEKSPKSLGRTLHWMQAIVVEPTPELSSVAIEIAAELVDSGGNIAQDVRDARFILLENGLLQQPVRGRCFIRSNLEETGSTYVDPLVTAKESTYKALQALGITTFEDGGVMLQLLNELAKVGKVDWDALWSAMRGSGEARVRDAFQEVLNGRAGELICVKDGHGSWVRGSKLYLAGDCFKQVKEDATYLVDGDYHSADQDLLGLLGIHRRPMRARSNVNEKWFSQYERHVKDTLAPEMGLGPQLREKIQIDSVESLLGPLQALPDLSDSNRTALTLEVLKSVHLPRVKVSHPNVNKSVQFIAPEIWWVKKNGMLPTTLGMRPISEAFSSSIEDEGLRSLLPTVSGSDIGEEAEAILGLRADVYSLTPTEFEALVDVHVGRNDLERVGLAYAWWCEVQHDSAPDELWVMEDDAWTTRRRQDVAIVTSLASYERFASFSIPSVLVGVEDVANMRDLWDCLEGQHLPITYSYETSAEPEVLTDVFDVLDAIELDVDPEEFYLQKCLSISEVAAVPGKPEVRVSTNQAIEGDTILVTGGSDREILQQVLACLKHDNSEEQVSALITDMSNRRNSKALRKIKNAPNDAARLLEFAGEARLRALIPKDALSYLKKSTGEEPQGEVLARLCTTMLGARALERACKVDPQGLLKPPPSSWNGSFRARSWVAQLGFSEEWAGEKAKRRNKPTEYVDGPTQLGELHDYQQMVSNRLTSLLVGEGPQRGLVTLPTGAGKTRVAVQSIVEAIGSGLLDKRSGDQEFSGPILWLTDGEELCEQAIDAWSYLWRAVGRQDTQLVLSRFWANYEMEEEVGGVQVVIATWQKIASRAVDAAEFAWLSEAPVVVIDEAHRALHRTYTEILTWLGRDSRKREKPLIGLTATPFRGRRESEETRRLLKRFDNNLLDEGVFGSEIPQLKLQRDRVLARAHLEILTGSRIKLTEKELDEFKKSYWLPKNAETKLGKDEIRTRTILESILSKPEDWQIVLFAASVEAAQTLATLLTLSGRPASSIDQDTSPDDRRTAIARFKKGELKVLTNYAVLSQGFDAPRTDAVYITRPTSSEVRYQQMVGRGLRGPENGGTEEVLIVNVIDNILEFGDSIVYQQLQEIVDIEQGYAAST